MSHRDGTLVEERIRRLVRGILRESGPGGGDSGVMTAGELRRALRAAKGRRLAALGGEVAKKAGLYGLKAALGALPGGGTLSAAIEAGIDLGDIVGKARDLKPREKKSSPLWDILSVDPDVSDVVHDEVEDRFIADFTAGVEGLPDEAPLPNADRELARWLSREYDGLVIGKPKG